MQRDAYVALEIGNCYDYRGNYLQYSGGCYVTIKRCDVFVNLACLNAVTPHVV